MDFEEDEPTHVSAETPSTGETRPSRDESDADLPLYIGRFYILKRLGAGGMGQVFVGFDEDLGRRVAIKVLHGGGGPAEHDRMRREAQALAQLSHPNVVQVYEVGEHDGSVFVAMEYVQGELLRAWAKGRRRREILEAFQQAGAGLAAAHRAGLVHRDFKPSNVIVGRDGRVRVMDFGLASGALTARDPKEHTVVRATRSVLWDEHAQAGPVMGTPGYMAPEQWMRAPIDARTDQFAFCVALWEAMCGEKPFVGRTAKTLQISILGGQRREPPKGSRMPGWVRRALVRGLAKDPAQRWPGMPELLAELAAGPKRRWLWIAAVVQLAIAAIVVGVVVVRRSEARALADRCHAAGREITAAWEPGVQSRVRAGLIAAAPEFGATAFEHARPFVDDFVAAWADARARACMLPNFDPRWTPAVVGRAEACLAAARWSLEGAALALAEADAGVVQRAVQLAAELPAVAPCLDVGYLSRRPDVSGVAADEAARLQKSLHAVRSLQAVGRAEAGLEQAKKLIGEADALAVKALAAEARMAAGSLAASRAAWGEAEALLEDGLMLAAEAGEEALVADAATMLAEVVVGQGRLADGQRWGRLAWAKVTAQGEAATLRGARVLDQLARVDAAQQEHERALDRFTRALEIRTQFLGPVHPDVARSLASLGEVHLARGQHAEARQRFERSLEIRERTLGADHPEVASALTSLAGAIRRGGDAETAERLSLRALAIRERTLGTRHPDVAAALAELGAAYLARGERARAEPLLERSLAIYAEVLGLDHPQLAEPLTELADLYLHRQALDQAKKAYARALAIAEKAHGKDDVACAAPQAGLGEVARRRGREVEAQRRLEKALALFDAAARPTAAARVRFSLAQLLLGGKKTRPRALELAREAAAALRAAEEPLAGEIEAWLARAEEPPPAPAKQRKKKAAAKKKKKKR